MSFSDNIKDGAAAVTTFLSFRPRKRITGWTVNGTYSNVYEAQWSEPYTVGVYGSSLDSADQELSLADCASSDYSWFQSNGIIYFNPNGTNDPNDDVTVVEWECLVASNELNWKRNPLLSSSDDAHWVGGLIKAPVPLQGNTDSIFGYAPIQISSVQIQCADGFNLEHLHEWSLYGSQFNVWECAGPVEFSNISEIFTGVGGNFSLSDGVLTMQVSDPLRLLDEPFDVTAMNFTDYPNMQFVSGQTNYVRKLYGMVAEVEPVNISYNATPSTSNNRVWSVCEGDIADAATLELSIDHLSGSNTSTTTKVSAADGLVGPGATMTTGDSIIIQDNGVDKYATVVSVDYTTDIVTHSAIGARSPVSTDKLKRGFIGSLSIRAPSGLVSTVLQYGRDWTEASFNSLTPKSRYFTLANNFEALHGILGGPFDPETMPITCRVYGDKTLPKQLDNTTDLGQVGQRGGCVSNPVAIVWDILRNRVRGFDSKILLDETAWDTLATSFDRPVGLMVPESASGSVPTYKAVIQQFLQTELLRAHFKIDSSQAMLTITQAGSSGTPVSEINSSINSRVDYSWDYSELVSQVTAVASLGLRTFTNTVDSETAEFLHRTSKAFSFETLFQFSDHNVLMANRLLAILAERSGTLTCVVPVEFVEANIDDTITVSSDRLPGVEKTGLINSRPYVVIQHARSHSGVTLVLDDQKGIDDSGGW